jgi:hypothetical protein
LDLLNYETEACVTGDASNTACATLTEAGIIVNPAAVGTQEPLSALGIEMLVQPNPAQDFIYVGLSESVTGQVQVAVISTDGRIVATRNAEGLALGNTIALDVHDVAAGVYLVRLQSDKGSSTSKVVIR